MSKYGRHGRLVRPNVFRSVLMFLSDRRTGDHHRQCRQRRRGNHDLFARRRPVRLLDALAARPHYDRTRRGPRDVRANGRGHGQRLLADLIRENFGVKVTFWCLLLFVLGDIGNTATEFAGVASSAPIFGSYLHVFNAEAFKIALVAGAAIFAFKDRDARKRQNDRARLLLLLFRLRRLRHQRVRRPPRLARRPAPKHRSAYSGVESLHHYGQYRVVIGTTISPWMQFYIQAAVVEKGIREGDYGLLAPRRGDRRNMDRRDRVLHYRLLCRNYLHS